MTLPALTDSMTFDEAARTVLLYLREQVPMGLWSVTRVENGRQSYLYLDDNAYGAPQGGSHPWAESFCIHMAAGTAPPVAPDAQAIPLYAAAGVNALAPIGSYAGSAIKEPDGQLFGAICGIDPDRKTGDARFNAAAPLLVLLGQLLTIVLAAERAREVASVQALESQLAADTDALTGLYSRRAWDRLISEELVRFARLGDPTVVVMTDLDHLKRINDQEGHEAGDEYLRRAARALRCSVRDGDVVARLGGDEFGLLLRNCSEATAVERVRQIAHGMTTAGVATSVGWAPVTLVRGLPAALAEADEAMYAAKRERRSLVG
jgi:diguanylate cyclase (GGDEF)-like protein